MTAYQCDDYWETDMHRVATNVRQLLAGLLLAALAFPAQAAWDLSMTRGVTSMVGCLRPAYAGPVDLRLQVSWSSPMIYALFTFRKSKGAVPPRSRTVRRRRSSRDPDMILVFLGYESAPALIHIEDTRNSEMTIKITGYQWSVAVQYVDGGYSFFSALAKTSSAARQLGS